MFIKNMKKLIAILLFPFFVKSQITINFKPYPQNPNANWTVSDIGHYYISAGMAVGFGLLAYKGMKKETRYRKLKACFFGEITSLTIGIFGKEIVHDKWMKLGVPSFNDGVIDFMGASGGTLGLRVGLEIHELRMDKKATQVKKIKRLNHDKDFNW